MKKELSHEMFWEILTELIFIGKENSVITAKQIEEHFKDFELDEDRMGEMYETFELAKIEVVGNVNVKLAEERKEQTREPFKPSQRETVDTATVKKYTHILTLPYEYEVYSFPKVFDSFEEALEDAKKTKLYEYFMFNFGSFSSKYGDGSAEYFYSISDAERAIADISDVICEVYDTICEGEEAYAYFFCIDDWYRIHYLYDSLEVDDKYFTTKEEAEEAAKEAFKMFPKGCPYTIEQIEIKNIRIVELEIPNDVDCDDLDYYGIEIIDEVLVENVD